MTLHSVQIVLGLSLCAELDETWLQEETRGREALTPWKCEEDGRWKEGGKMQVNSGGGGVLCHRRSARREH